MDEALPNPAAFFHVRVIIGVVVGLAITRILNGLARFVRGPARGRAYGVHTAWAFFLLLMVVHFWWFEFALERVGIWTFPTYAFLIGYGALHFFTAAVLFPDDQVQQADFVTIFHENRPWFFGLLLALIGADFVDTVLKGSAHFDDLGIPYLFRQGALAVLAIAAMAVSDRRSHVAIVTCAIAVEVWWIVARYGILAG